MTERGRQKQMVRIWIGEQEIKKERNINDIKLVEFVNDFEKIRKNKIEVYIMRSRYKQLLNYKERIKKIDTRAESISLSNFACCCFVLISNASEFIFLCLLFVIFFVFFGFWLLWFSFSWLVISGCELLLTLIQLSPIK